MNPPDLRRPGRFVHLREAAAAAPPHSIFAVEVVWQGHARWVQPAELRRRLALRTWPKGSLVRFYSPAAFMRYLDAEAVGIGSKLEDLPPLEPLYD